METLFIPQPDTIPVSWGWFQFLLLLTFPLHILAMNAMVGGLAIGIVQHFKGGVHGKQLAHRIAIALPLVIAFVVNFGVAPLLFVQVLYGQFVYTSSVLMGAFWILIVPILIVAYYGAYLYDFKFTSLGWLGPWIGITVLILLGIIAFFFSNNMLLMVLPERFGDYFAHKSGDLLSMDRPEFWPRYLHMIVGSLAVGGLFVGLLGRFKKNKNRELAVYSENVGLKVFLFFTLINIFVGIWYLLSLPQAQKQLFLGGSLAPTLLLLLGIVLAAAALFAGMKKKYFPTVIVAILLVTVMTIVRSWLRSDYLAEHFTLDQLQLVPQYSPFLFFVVTLLLGVVCIVWLLRKTSEAID